MFPLKVHRRVAQTRLIVVTIDILRNVLKGDRLGWLGHLRIGPSWFFTTDDSSWRLWLAVIWFSSSSQLIAVAVTVRHVARVKTLRRLVERPANT